MEARGEAGNKKGDPYKDRLVERETGVGPATSTLARWRSTTELFPQKSAPFRERVVSRAGIEPATRRLRVCCSAS